MTRWSALIASVLAALALSAAAGAQNSASEMGRVLGERWEKGAALSPYIERARARAELESALAKHGYALNDLLASTQPVGQGLGGGFAWGAAAIGAGTALGPVLLAFAAVFKVRRARPAAQLP